MAQCKKILDNGERCSNRAVPGTDYCEEHRGGRTRIQFRKVSRETAVKAAEAVEDKEPAESHRWTAQPSAAGDAPAFPGLSVNEDRNTLVAPEALIWFGEEDTTDPSGTLFGRLARLLGYLSQEISLAGQVSVQTISKGTGYVVSLTPQNPEAANLSRVYDVASNAAALSNGLLYIGEGRLFIQYRDGDAPRGYDAQDVKPPRGNAFYLVDSEGTHTISPRSLTDEALDDVLLRIPPLRTRDVDLPDSAFVLAALPLYRMLAKYFRSHHLNYRVSRFHYSNTGENGDSFILFEIAPRPDASTGTLVPAFVLSYLSGLPRCAVLTEVEANAGRQMLVEYGYRYPCLPRNILDVFASDCLLLFMTGPDFPNLCVSPIPTFFEGDELISVQAERPAALEMKPVASQEDLAAELPVKLTHDPGPTPPTAALILDSKETEWMRRLLYRLPGEVFDSYSLCLGQERAVLLGEGMAVDSIPFGIPLRRIQDTQLFIPLRARLTPDLPWKLLVDVLDIKEDIYTFMTLEFRLDVPRDAFSPLSRTLAAEPGRPRVEFNVRPLPNLPSLRWTPPKPEEKVRQTRTFHRKTDQQSEEISQRMPQIVRQPREVQSVKDHDVAQERSGQDPKDVLLRQAESYRQQGDYLSAAICFTLADDRVNAALCYKEAVRSITTGGK